MTQTQLVRHKWRDATRCAYRTNRLVSSSQKMTTCVGQIDECLAELVCPAAAKTSSAGSSRLRVCVELRRFVTTILWVSGFALHH
jgi:hypothetical protein